MFMGLGVSCEDEFLVCKQGNEMNRSLPFAVNALLLGDGRSRLLYEEETDSVGLCIRNTWQMGDGITVCVQGYSDAYATYRLVEGAGTSSGMFERDIDKTGGRNSSCYGVYYPSTITSDQLFFQFSYENQVQRGNGNMEHLARFHTIRALEMHEDETVSTLTPFTGYVDFSIGEVAQSGCMKFVLSDFPVMEPRRITLMKVDENGFVTNDFFTCNYTQGIRWSTLPPSSSHELSIELQDIALTNRVDAYMMMSCQDIQLKSGERFRILLEDEKDVYYADKAIVNDAVLSGGKLHVLTVSGSESWKKYDLQSSTAEDYDNYDGKVICLQKATAKIQIPTDLVLMGDGFIGEDFADGTYREAMEKACEDFFSVQPLKSLRDHFNVYYVNAVSENRFQIQARENGAVSTMPAVTKFNTFLVPNKTDVGGNVERVVEYVEKALTGDDAERQSSAQVVVVLNADCHAGTCIRYYNALSSVDYGDLYSIAFCTMNTDEEARRLTLVHEAVGHGFGKLADEYGGVSYFIDPVSVWTQLALFHKIGFDRNIDKYDEGIDEGTVYWSKLMGTYKKTEGLGVYHEDGAYTVSRDFCRPTVNSIMRNQFDKDPDTGYFRFNPASRWAIWYRLKCLTGTLYECYEVSCDDFIAWDSQLEHQDEIPSQFVLSRSRLMFDSNLLSSPPISINGYWKSGRFIGGD